MVMTGLPVPMYLRKRFGIKKVDILSRLLLWIRVTDEESFRNYVRSTTTIIMMIIITETHRLYDSYSLRTILLTKFFYVIEKIKEFVVVPHPLS